ncbi:transcriptional regulator, TetR family [Jatrophihabitans endophyticus]|uniref:Transcriptional regulator, TetR family n=1 Tax=Jatrophihabitans endophyticus TaxID=1206085 RepID=A0A1M5MX52_9ACTN|nr:TetR family transcriptional regulator [Jatrophihabitans endophyticus]SHG81916.1 transcriptional regulator, TetR family [Jatrophihabitans endophyticus]
MSDTRARLLAAAAATLRDEGIAGLSARTVAARAEVNQALIFYHYKTLPGLVDAAVRTSVEDSVASYRARFAAVGSLVELLRVGRELHERERSLGNVAMMAQLLAGAQRDPVLAGAARHAMTRWNAEIEAVVRRVLAGSPLAEIADPAGTAAAISAGFLGLELYEGVDAAGATAALDALERLGALVEVVDDLGPVARRALRAKVRRLGRP